MIYQPSHAIPVPPEQLRWRAVGTKDLDKFLKSGVRAVTFFSEILEEAGENLQTAQRILDFGCGCGRILRALPSVTDAQLTGCDIDPQAIGWCAENLPFANFHAVSEYPPLPFPDDAFDFIYGLSVFTHLDEQHQFSWLRELHRVSSPVGYLLLTFKGAEHLSQQSIPNHEKTQIIAQLESKGFIFRKTAFWRGVFPDFYNDAFHSAEYVYATWGKYFEILQIVPPRVLQQFAVLCKMKA